MMKIYLIQKKEKYTILKFTNIMIMKETFNYFNCRYFKNQVLTSVVLKAKDEIQVKEIFNKKFKKYNLIEVIKIL
jgi:hypothetical protein